MSIELKDRTISMIDAGHPAIWLRPSITLIDGIRWEQRHYIACGCFGFVFEVLPEVVAKVGSVKPPEVKLQALLARQGLAVPVLDYRQDVLLPRDVCMDICVPHGILRWPDYVCHCTRTEYAVMLMPKVEPVIIDIHFSKEMLDKFSATITARCRDLNHRWDAHHHNIGSYKGRLVALDFGV